MERHASTNEIGSNRLVTKPEERNGTYGMALRTRYEMSVSVSGLKQRSKRERDGMGREMERRREERAVGGDSALSELGRSRSSSSSSSSSSGSGRRFCRDGGDTGECEGGILI